MESLKILPIQRMYREKQSVRYRRDKACKTKQIIREFAFQGGFFKDKIIQVSKNLITLVFQDIEDILHEDINLLNF